MKRFLIPFVLAAVSLHVAQAAPTVSSVQGTFGNRQAVTIQGSGFGTKSPAAPLIWADFETGLNPSAGGLKSQWNEVQSLQWVAKEGVGGGGAAKASDGSGIWTLRVDFDSWTRDGQTMYIFKKERLNFLVTDLTQNWKSWRMWPTGNGYPNIYANPNTGRVFVEKVSADDSGFYGDLKVPSTNWSTQEIIMRASSINQKNGWVNIRYDGRSVADGAVITRSSEAPLLMNWNYVVHGVVANHSLWSPSWSDSNRIWSDDVYVDTTWARVLIGNAPTFSACTQLEIQLPTSWNSNSISIIAHSGAMPVGARAYVYVFDASNSVNAQGFPVTIGASGTADPKQDVVTPSLTASAGPDVIAAVNTDTPLRGAVVAVGIQAALSTQWTALTGEGNVEFSNPASADTTARFSEAGTYTLQLSATDGSRRALDTVTVTAVPSIAATGGVQPKNVFNPVGGETYRILYQLEAPGRLEAELIDRTGKLVRAIDGGERPAGEQYLEWDGRNESGEVVASGIYLVVKKINGKRSAAKVAVIK